MKRGALVLAITAYAFLTGCTTTPIAPSVSSIESEKDVEQAQYHVKMGSGYMSRRDFANAKKQFLLAAKFDSADKQIWRLAGHAARYNLDFDESIHYFNKVIQLQPDDYSAYGNIGSINRQLRRYDEAIAAFEKALELNSEDLWSAGYLAHIYYELKDYEKCQYYMDEYEAILSRKNMDILPEIMKIGIESTLAIFSNYRKAISK